MKRRGLWYGAGTLFVLFALLTAALIAVDARPIGPQGSRVGLAAINQFFRAQIGVNMMWYRATDDLGAIPLVVACGFAGAGLYQLIRRRRVGRVDRGIAALGVIYLMATGCYALFEVLVVNYRPVLIQGQLEASFPSSHTMLALVIMVTGMLFCHARLNNKVLRVATDAAFILVAAIISVGRLLSGVHWFTDILGGLLLGGALVVAYGALLPRHGAPRT